MRAVISLDRNLETEEQLVHLRMEQPFAGSVYTGGKDHELIASAREIKAIVESSGADPVVTMVKALGYTRYPDRDTRDLDSREAALGLR